MMGEISWPGSRERRLFECPPSASIPLAAPLGAARPMRILGAEFWVAPNAQASVEYQSEAGLVTGDITSLEVVVVPEPSTLAALALGG